MNNHPAPKSKLAPEHVRECLSRDVHAILSVCIHQFKEEQEIDEKCFDVDAVVTGRSLQPKVRYESRVAPASWATGRVAVSSDRPYSTSGKGSFIPAAHFGPRFA